MALDYKRRKVAQMGYVRRWAQELMTYAPRAWAVMSFILPLVVVPIAAKVAKKGYEYAKKKMK